MHAVAITNHELRSTRLIRQIRREILSDLPIYAVAVVYAVVAGIWLGDLRALVGGGASSYGEIIGTIAISLFLPTAAAGLCIAALIADPRSPLRQIGRWLAGLNVARLVAGLALLLPTATFLPSFAAVKSTIAAGGFLYDRPLADIGWYFFGGRNPIDVLHAVADPAIFAPAIDYVYSTTWFVWIYGILLYMAMSGTPRLRLRYFLSVFLAWGLLGNVTAALVSSAGPCFYGAVTGDTRRFAAAMDALRGAIGHDTGAIAFQDLLWRMHESGVVGVGAGISAFPSMHVAAATLNALFLAERGRVMATAGWTYVALILFGSVYLGWHYAVDGLFSIPAVIVLHAVMRRLMPDVAPKPKL